MRAVLLVLLVALGCGRVSYLPRLDGETYPPTERVELLFREPAQPYTELGLLTVESKRWSEETMVRELRAERIGANAVILNSPSQRATGAVGVYVGGGVVVSSTEDTRRMEGLAIRWVAAPVAGAP